MLPEINSIFTINTPIFHPKQKYGVLIDEVSLGIAEYRLKDKEYFWVKIDKDNKFVYRINVANVKKYIKQNPKAIDKIKDLKIFVIPIKKYGKQLKLYRRYSLSDYEELREKNKYLRSQGLPVKYDL